MPSIHLTHIKLENTYLGSWLGLCCRNRNRSGKKRSLSINSLLIKKQEYNYKHLTILNYKRLTWGPGFGLAVEELSARIPVDIDKSRSFFSSTSKNIIVGIKWFLILKALLWEPSFAWWLKKYQLEFQLLLAQIVPSEEYTRESIQVK